jgi:hypothetical protein
VYALLLTMLFDDGIDDFSTHQTPPARHPYLSACGHVHKVIDDHGALTSGALHQ